MFNFQEYERAVCLLGKGFETFCRLFWVFQMKAIHTTVLRQSPSAGSSHRNREPIPTCKHYSVVIMDIFLSKNIFFFLEAAISKAFNSVCHYQIIFFVLGCLLLDCNNDKALGVFVSFGMLISQFPFDLFLTKRSEKYLGRESWCCTFIPSSP